ncbi:hypothetical protein [Dolosicoccus paucivorans]
MEKRRTKSHELGLFEDNDYYIDPRGVRFNFHAYRTQTDKYGLTRDFKEYVAETVDVNQQPVLDALTKKRCKRRIQVNPSYEYVKAQTAFRS